MGETDDFDHDPESVAYRPGEPFLTRTQLAQLMGVSEATVDRMRADGMKSFLWGRRTRRFQASSALEWANSGQWLGRTGTRPVNGSTTSDASPQGHSRPAPEKES